MVRRLLLTAWVASAFLQPLLGAVEEEKNGSITWELSGEARFRPEWRDDADLDRSTNDDLRQGFMRLRVGLLVGNGETWKLFVQAQDSRVAGDEASTASNEKNLDLHQGYLDLKATDRLALIIGRQELRYGDERLIGAFGWNNIGRSFDVVKARYSRERFWLDGFFARVSSSTIAGATSGSDLYGVYTQTAPRKGSEYETYLLSFAQNIAEAGETGVDGETSIRALGARAKDQFGPFDFSVEAVAQRGELQGDDLEAHAAAGQAGVSWGENWKARTFAGYDYATGDEDPSDGERQEFFNFFPTNHPHYGYADYQSWRNVRSPWGGVSLSHGRHFSQVKLHRFLLEEERGPWKDAAGNVLGSDPTGALGTHVGGEIDVTYRIAWKEKIVLEGGLSHFQPGRFARLTRGSDPSWWAYAQLTLSFGP